MSEREHVMAFSFAASETSGRKRLCAACESRKAHSLALIRVCACLWPFCRAGAGSARGSMECRSFGCAGFGCSYVRQVWKGGQSGGRRGGAPNETVSRQ